MEAKRQEKLSKLAEAEVMRRAAVAYFDGRLRDQPGNWPDEVESGVERHGRGDDGHLFAVLRDRRGKFLACYRVRHDGQLKRAVRLPSGIA